jgi:PHD/YefM family antitoxin component YafN of YafNO toxin-antitoxin module
MKMISTADNPESFDELLEAERQAPVAVIDGSRPAAVVISIEDCERMRGAAWGRLMRTMERIRARVRERGMTDATLESPLADDS